MSSTTDHPQSWRGKFTYTIAIRPEPRLAKGIPGMRRVILRATIKHASINMVLLMKRTRLLDIGTSNYRTESKRTERTETRGYGNKAPPGI
jgi:hypothetical protein